MTHAQVRLDSALRPPAQFELGPSIPGGAVFPTSFKAGSCAAAFEIRPTPSPLLLPTLAAALGLGVAANIHHEDPLVARIGVRLFNPVSVEFCEIGRLYEALTGVSVTITPTTDAHVMPDATGDVFLVSGGKDSLWVLNKYASRKSTSGLHAIYLAGGAELSWHTELASVQRVAKHFGLSLHVYELHTTCNSSRALLRFPNRATWRELITITLARGFGDTVYTGINIDSVARLENPRPHLEDHLSQLVPTLRALRATLGARMIYGAPGEFAVYRTIRFHEFFDVGGSCLTPSCAPGVLCNKCRTFSLYDKRLAGTPFTPDDLGFGMSAAFIGDPVIFEEDVEEEGDDDHVSVGP